MDLSFLNDKAVSIKHKVRGHDFNFYPATVRGAYLVKGLGRPIMQALSTLFGGVGQETGHNERAVTKPTGEIATSSEDTAIDPALAKLRIEARERSIGSLFDTLLDEKNGPVMAEIIADSLQDDWQRDERTGKFDQKEIAAFWGKLDVPTAVEFLVGVCKANKPVFDPLVEGLRVPSALARGSSPSPSSDAQAASQDSHQAPQAPEAEAEEEISPKKGASMRR